MRIDSIQLTDWRNFEEALFEFEPGVNLILGANGSGKTNLLEAVGYLSFARSFRKSADKDLIKNGAEEAFIKGVISSATQIYKMAVEAQIKSAKKKIMVDGKKESKLSSFVGTVLTMVFEPKSVFLFKDEPSQRRRLMDEVLSSTDPKYLYSLQRYKKVLKERNQALLAKADDEVITFYTEQLIRFSYQLVNSRVELVKTLERLGNEYFKKLYGEDLKLVFKYRTTTLIADDMEEFSEKMKDEFDKKKSYERIHRMTIIGPHRDDLTAYIDGKPVGSYGSQGQNRLVSLAVTLALGKLCKEKKGEDPVLILDDVLSDLDEEKQERLMDTVKDFEQVLLSGSSIAKSVAGANIIKIDSRKEVEEGIGG